MIQRTIVAVTGVVSRPIRGLMVTSIIRYGLPRPKTGRLPAASQTTLMYFVLRGSNVNFDRFNLRGLPA